MNQPVNELIDIPQLDVNDIEKNFPFDTFRTGQKECIEFIINAFNTGKKFVAIEGPTGAGKSAIGICISKFFQKAYYLTITKILQTQLQNDFGTDGSIVELKGRATYPCTVYEKHQSELLKRMTISQSQIDKQLLRHPDCNNGYCKKCGDSKCTWCIDAGTCTYFNQITKAQRSQLAIMNFSSFLYQTSMVKGRFNVRDLLVIDECHQTESQLLNFISLSINDKALKQVGYTLPMFDNAEEYWLHFVENKIVDHLTLLIKAAKEAENIRQIEEYTTILYKINKFFTAMEQGEEWIADYETFRGNLTVTLKPIFVKSKSDQLMFQYGQKVLFMSATILDVNIMCDNLGISKSDVAAYRMKNQFPVKNRPIYIKNTAGRIVGGNAKLKEWGPKIIKVTNDIIGKHKNQRGIIHTHNFAIANLLLEKSKHKHRFLFQKNYANKEEMLEDHSNQEDSIIVAPAMHEGIDLRDDLSRFQIICKVPWPNYFNDKQLARRVELNRSYYLWITALKLVQSYGRSVRNDKDYADTYVIDEVFTSFIKQAKSMLPQWFLEAVIH